MNALNQQTYGRPVDALLEVSLYDDPLDDDAVSDNPVVATRRKLTRLALIAAETGARFEREGEGRDPMGWLLAPRRLFGGSTAVDSVLDKDNFMRALILHGLSMSLDAEPEMIDDLLLDVSDDEFLSGQELAAGDGSTLDDMMELLHDQEEAGEGADEGRWVPQLFTATLLHEDGSFTLQAFHASICHHPIEIYERLARRYGSCVARRAHMSVGFDPSSTFAEALVSPALSRMLQLVEEEPCSELAAGLDVNLEQRFAA